MFHRPIRYSRGCPVSMVALAAMLLALSGAAGQAWAEPADSIEGRLSLTASYGFLALFHQDANDGDNPVWGHGIYLRLGGERCGRLCVGLSGLGSINVSPESTGSAGVGPHIATRWAGPDWAGPYVFRTGLAYYWTYTPEPEFLEGTTVLGDRRSGHGLGLWFELDLELIRNRAFTIMAGIRGRYSAVVSTDPVEHHLTAQATLGFTLGRRLLFGEQELDVPPETDSGEGEDEDEDEDVELDEMEERRLREAEETLRE